MPRDLPLLKEKFVMISFRSVADFKKHLLSAHKDAEKICIYDGCNWSCSKQATYNIRLSKILKAWTEPSSPSCTSASQPIWRIHR
jgi:hypothetical protein